MRAAAAPQPALLLDRVTLCHQHHVFVLNSDAGTVSSFGEDFGQKIDLTVRIREVRSAPPRVVLPSLDVLSVFVVAVMGCRSCETIPRVRPY